MILGKLEVVPLRSIWTDEARDFTPWIASEEGLEALGEVLDLNLTLVKTEKEVGTFSADVLARDSDDENHLILVENQLEKTNHDHLGKLITYSAGLDVKTMIWIASSFTDEHRAAIDWLNKLSNGQVGFVAIEVEALKIGDSIPAPHLKVIAKPNEWSQIVKASGEGVISDTKLDQQKFWEELKDYMASNYPNIHAQTPKPRHWYNFAVGKSGAHISLTLNSREGKAGCELYLAGKDAKTRFDSLVSHKEEIEKELGLKLNWLRLEEKTASRIVTFKKLDFENPGQRNELLLWMAKNAEQFIQVFTQRAKYL